MGASSIVGVVSDFKANDSNDSPWAVVCFALPLSSVDELMEVLAHQRVRPSRWIVFSEDMSLLGALVAHWEPTIDLVVTGLPAGNAVPIEGLIDAALGVLESEQVALARCVWVQGEGATVAPPAGVGAFVVWREQSTDQLAAEVVACHLP